METETQSQLSVHPTHRRLLQRHKVIMDFHLAGLSHKAIAEHVGMTPQAIGNIIRQPFFQQALARRQAVREDAVDSSHVDRVSEAVQFLNANSLSAAERLRAGVDSDDERVALRSAVDILKFTIGEKGQAGPTVLISQGDAQVLQIALNETGGSRIRDLPPGKA